MNKELITLNNGTYLLDEKVSSDIANFERQIKKIKDKEEELKKMILAEMKVKNIKSIKDEVNGLLITYIEATEREDFDKKKFRNDNPDLYDKYVKFTGVKSSIRIKVD